LPFASDYFDAVVSQFGLMFFADRVAALREMRRVLRPGGRLALAVWDDLDQSPGYAAMYALLARLFGDEVGAALRSPFTLGDPNTLRTLFRAAGMSPVTIETRSGMAHFPSLQAWVATEIKGWVLADVLDDAQYNDLQRAAQRELGAFVTPDGDVRFPAPAHIVTTTKPGAP
jgi:SAM-dependent methyltransferase